MLSDMPRGVLRLLSSRMIYPGVPMYEFTLLWGLIPIVIACLFFAGLHGREELSHFEWRLFRFSGVVYFLIVLAMYGSYSALSDLLYAVPGIGKMHIYQRHLLAGHWFFLIGVGLMLNAVVRRGPSVLTKLALFILLGMMAVSAHLLAVQSTAVGPLLLNDYLVLELLLAALFTASLFFPGTWFPFGVATFLILLVSLNHVYEFSTNPELSYATQQTRQIALDRVSSERVISYFRTNSHRAIVKYVDMTPGVREYFSKNYPWFVAKDIALASYSGYEFQLAARSDYLQRMPTIGPGEKDLLLHPDWKWVEKTGAEFVVFQEQYGMNDPHLGEVADLRNPARVLKLPNHIVIAPLRFEAAGFGAAAIRGRYVRVQLSGKGWLSLAEVRVMARRGDGLLNVAQGKRAAQSSTFGTMGVAAHAVDGNTNGDFGKNSVSHTNEDENAWWEVDLGSSEAVESVAIWGRTDCCGERLGDYWVFASDAPFAPSDTPASLQQRARTVSTHQTVAPVPSVVLRGAGSGAGAGGGSAMRALFDNGYLRVLGAENSAAAGGFRTDGASELDLEVRASKPVKVQYLFWPSDRLKFYLQGKPVPATIEDGLQTVTVPSGRQRLEIRYVSWPLRIFLALYSLYALVYVAALAEPALLAVFTRR
jgi:F5/8 type C domain